MCAIIRKHLGITDLDWSYRIEDEDDSGRVAACFTPNNGWYGTVLLYPSFFRNNLDSQVASLIHEHLHVAMIPQDQATTAAFQEYVIERDRQCAERIVNLGREITVSRLEVPLANLLWPLIKKVL